MRKFVIGRALCLAGFALGAATVSAAQPNAGTEAAAHYDLPAQDLDLTLRAIAQASGHEILFPSDLVQGRTAPAISGRLTLDQALRFALSGTSLVVEHRGTAVLIRAPAATPNQNIAPGGDAPSITVTGTRIRGVGSTSPVIVNTRRSLEQAGVTDLAAYTRILPQNFTGGQNPGVVGGGEQAGMTNLNNSATLNLRGLGPDATLTLVNGHRLAYDAVDQGIDIAAIPLEAIDRIEVVADGASALYGSDAVGGVANIILRPDYEGVETTARIGGSTSGGNFQQEYSLVGGHRWSSGGFMAAVDRSTATPVFADQRDYTRTVDRSLTLLTANRQWSGVLTGHQQIAPTINFQIDGYGTDRAAYRTNPFLPTADVTVSGVVTQTHLRSYAVTPTVTADLGPWRASLSATGAVSRTVILSTAYFSSVPNRVRITYEDKLAGADTNAEGPLISLPGGNARLALGGGYRRLSLHAHALRLRPGQSITAINYTQRRDVEYGYGELSAPIIGPEQRLPLVDRLTFSGALRYERWNGIGAVTTPKVGLIYQPVRDVTVRGTWGKSFKVPTLYQVNEVRQGALMPAIYFVPPPQPAGSTVLLLGGGTPGLKPERATTWSATIEARPRFFSGLSVGASYFHVDYRGRVGVAMTDPGTALYNPIFSDLIIYNPSVSQVNAIIGTLPQGLMNETGAPFDPANVGAIIDATLHNTARQRIHGLDLSGDYRLDLGRSGRLLLTAAGSYLQNRQQLAPNQPFLERAGTIFNPPHWRGRAGVVWEGRTAGLSAFVNYLGPTTDNRYSVVETIGSFVTLDLSGSIRTGRDDGPFRNIELRVSALNVLNEQPHLIRNYTDPNAAPYDSTNESAVGRFLGISVRKTW